MSWIRGRWTTVSLLLATPVTLIMLAICALAQVVTTTVTDTIFRADGTPAGGSIVVSWPAFTTSAGQAVTAGSASATIATNGVLTIALTPNAGATPLGAYYTVVYHLDDGSTNREYWVVPASSTPVKISSIRSSVLPTAVAMQTVSKSYVDTAIAAAVAQGAEDYRAPYVELARVAAVASCGRRRRDGEGRGGRGRGGEGESVCAATEGAGGRCCPTTRA